jgi:hypothetical protein
LCAIREEDKAACNNEEHIMSIRFASVVEKGRVTSVRYSFSFIFPDREEKQYYYYIKASLQIRNNYL